MPAATDGNTSSACPVIGADGTAPAPIFNVYAQQVNSADAQRRAAAEAGGGSALFPGAWCPLTRRNPRLRCPLPAPARCTKLYIRVPAALTHATRESAWTTAVRQATEAHHGDKAPSGGRWG
jgi:hypothetical protein